MITGYNYLVSIKLIAGELDWVLTAVLDTLAWQIEPDYARFKELFRNCKPVGLLFRGHILADRVMRAYNVTPVTHPLLPSLAGNEDVWGDCYYVITQL